MNELKDELNKGMKKICDLYAENTTGKGFMPEYLTYEDKYKKVRISVNTDYVQKYCIKREG